MRGFNRAIIAGNLTKDPEVRYTVNKKAYARFTVAVNNRYKDANGEFQDTADYITVVAWNNNAEICGKYLKKGSPVLVEGRIRTGSYDAKDGSGKRYTTEIYMDNMVMLGSGQGSSGSPGSSSSGMDSSFGMPPSEDNFGSSIGDSGFGGGSFTQSFANDNNSMSGSDASSIPF
ncbi:MAG: single-stranded DNA-binding protein [Synergistaceae bacterium]|nr:single-stranded DNA-binding protein [Synergistaceae bacterium]